MKKTLLLVAIAGIAFNTQAQLTLPASPYTQNFNALPVLPSGLPTGWSVYKSATSTSLGTVSSLVYLGAGGSEPSMRKDLDSSCASFVVSGGFKNFPSANVCHQDDDFCGSVDVASYSDRALGVRQVSATASAGPGYDPGPAFVLTLANTTGFKTFALSFKLQSLDTNSSRTTTWTVDYAIGASPTSFTTLTTSGSMTTGNKVFSNNTITGSFGTALDNKPGPIYIRIASLNSTSGSGTRASSAIDDFTLTYAPAVGVSDISAQPELSLTAIGSATSEKITLAYSAEEAGNYMLSIYDIAGRTIHTENVAAKAGTQSISVEGLHLAPGMYIAKMNNSNSSSVARIIVQ